MVESGEKSKCVKRTVPLTLIKDFEAKWRFTEEGYNILPAEDLNKIKPLSEEYSNKKWGYWISDTAQHFMMLENIKLGDVFCDDCGWGDEQKQDRVKNSLVKEMKLDENEPITFFWNSSIAVETEWGVFTKYWTDFCYAGDESNILVLHNVNKAVIYVNDKIWIVDRKKCFGRN